MYACRSISDGKVGEQFDAIMKEEHGAYSLLTDRDWKLLLSNATLITLKVCTHTHNAARTQAHS